MRRLFNRDGFIKPLITIGILAAVIYSAVQFGMPYYRYSAFKSEAGAISRLELGDAEKIRSEVYKAAKSFKLPLEEEDIIVTKKTNTVSVRTAWSVTVDLFGLYERKLDFKVDIEE